MTRGQPVSEAIQWTIICLSATIHSHEISGYTNISVHKVCDIISHFKKTGDIKSSKFEKFAACIGTYDANQLILVDESAVDCCTTYRGWAWALCG